MSIRSVLARTLLAACAALALLTLPACTSLEELIATRDQATSLADDLDRQATQIEQALATLPPTDPQRPSLEAALVQARQARDLYDADAARLSDIIAQAQSPTDPIAQAVGVVAPFLPVPARTPLVLGAALLGTLLRMHRLRQGLTSVARGFEIAKRDDPDFKARFAANTPTFRATQTPLARRVIEAAVK